MRKVSTEPKGSLTEPEAEEAGDTKVEAEATTGVEVATLKAPVLVSPQPSNEIIPVGGRLAHFHHKWTFAPWAHNNVSKGLG